ncbi:MAG: D-2-hydroxyacid dehydrogenase [Clostridiales bacterium]|nr:D-2-hydroxyacid dehydrogenase [Clostridiales bacterium]
MKNDKNIVVLLPFSDSQKQALEAMAPGCRFSYPDRQALTQELIDKAHVILGNVPASRLTGAANLEWMQLNSAGAREYIVSGHFPKGASLTNATGAYGLAISEHMLAMLLMLQKNLHRYHDNQKMALWRSEGPVTAIDGSTTLVIGLGDIGGEFARRMKHLGSYTIGIKRQTGPKPDFLDELHLTSELDELLPRADVVALSLPDTAATRHLLNRDRLSAMKKTAILLNVGRGNSIDTDALCDALANGQLLGAGMDVTDPEPLPSEHRLWKLPNVIITPHVSGGYSLAATRERILAIATDNFARYLDDRALVNLVDFEAGY